MQSVANVLAAAQQRHHTQEQLAHAQRLDAIGQVTGGIALDFNNLLTVVSGNLQLLDAGLSGRDDLLPIIGSALRAVGRGAELALDAQRLRPGIAVLLTSGYERPAPATDAQPGAEFELLRKPYRREDLAAAARRALDGREAVSARRTTT